MTTNKPAPAATPDPYALEATGVPPQPETSVMTGYEGLRIFTGDFMVDENADRSGEPDSTAAAPPEDGNAGPQDPPSTSPQSPADHQPAANDDQAGEEGKPEFRHKTWEDAEKSCNYYMTRATRAEQERARIERELQQQRDTQTQAEREKQTREQKEQFITKQYEEANREVDELDVDDPEYHTRVARIWARVHQGIDDFAPEFEDLPAASAAISYKKDTPAGEAPSVEMSREEINSRINEVLAAEKADFTLDDPAFVAICGRTPAEDETGNPLSIEDQIRRAVDQTRAHYEQLFQKHRQKTEQPLSRQGAGRSPGGQEASSEQQPGSFGDIIDAAVSSRVL